MFIFLNIFYLSLRFFGVVYIFVLLYLFWYFFVWIVDCEELDLYCVDIEFMNFILGKMVMYVNVLGLVLIVLWIVFSFVLKFVVDVLVVNEEFLRVNLLFCGY